ncbi:hypothetical protein [uncultured Marinobacter sp.]|uniref:hypothetical protein n=1 Tax=uncultured Marinobacter sp. TaxID=187379 RepID=UPI0030D8BFD2
MTIEQQITESLKPGPLHCGQIARAIGMDPFQTRAWLETMLKERLIVRELDGRYGLGYGGYDPEPEAA